VSTGIGAPELVAHPGVGRRFEVRVGVGLADTDPSGRCRLDALARFCQDAANADWSDAAPSSGVVWLVRRNLIRVREWPMLGDEITLSTWSSGVGRRWAERRTSITAAAGSSAQPSVETAALWVCVDAATGRPARLPTEFQEHFTASADGRTVDSKLRLPSDAPSDGEHRSWTTRRSDLDVVGHVNNTVFWAMAEEVAADLLQSGRPVDSLVEHRDPLEADGELVVATVGRGANWWCLSGGACCAAGVVMPA
jgi:acyl-ACP thioesterase